MPNSPANDDEAAETAADDGAVEQTPAPMNRAERRARGKAGGSQGGGYDRHGSNLGGKSAAPPSPRQWANRRSG